MMIIMALCALVLNMLPRDKEIYLLNINENFLVLLTIEVNYTIFWGKSQIRNILVTDET